MGKRDILSVELLTDVIEVASIFKGVTVTHTIWYPQLMKKSTSGPLNGLQFNRMIIAWFQISCYFDTILLDNRKPLLNI